MRRGRTAVGAAIAVAMLCGTPQAIAANENAVCIGENISAIATEYPRAVGAFASFMARTFGGVGQFVGPEASSDSCP